MANGERRSENGDPRAVALSLLASLLLLSLIAILHYDALAEWWKTDDPQIVLHAIRNTPFETLFAPAEWRTLSIGCGTERSGWTSSTSAPTRPSTS